MADTLERCRVLFFGGQRGDLSAYVVRDLGITRFERYQINERYFASREELDCYFGLADARRTLARLHDAPALADGLVERLRARPARRSLARRRNALLIELGRWFERHDMLERALTCYVACDVHPGRERMVRVHHRLGDQSAVTAGLQAIRSAPLCDEERLFAERFGVRQRAAAGLSMTRVRLPGATPQAIERHALSVLCGNGARAWHCENAWPLGLTGLACWEVIFAPVDSAFANPFQTAPLDLFWDDFVTARDARIRSLFARLADPAALQRNRAYRRDGEAGHCKPHGRLAPVDAGVHRAGAGVCPARTPPGVGAVRAASPGAGAHRVSGSVRCVRARML